jgi:Tol biopolymer transport system component
MSRSALILASLLLPATALGKAKPIGPSYEANCQSPRWSPDGSRLAYEVNFHDRKSIEQYVLIPGQGEPNQVRPLARGASAITAGFATAAAEMVVHELSWAPAQIGAFVYAASGPDRDYDLYIDQSGAPVVASPGADGGPKWSPDGRWIAFTSARTGQGDIYLLDTQHIDQPPRQLTDAPTSAELYIAWAPESQRLAYVGHSDDGDKLYLIEDLAKPAPRALTHWGQTQTRPSFSPDGRQIAFYSNHRDPSSFDLFLLPLGGTATLVAERVVMDSDGPAWTPDGSHLVYVLDDETRYDPVYAAPVATPSRAAPVATGTVGNGDLDVSFGTDGRIYMAVAAQGLAGDARRDFKRIYVMELDALP